MGKRKKPDLPKLACGVLAAPLAEDDAARAELLRRGVEPNGAGAMLLAQWEKAAQGELKAAQFLRELVEKEEPGKKAAPARAALDLRELSDEQLQRLLADYERGRTGA